MENKRNVNYAIPMLMAVVMAVGLIVGHSLAPSIKKEEISGQSNDQKIQDIIRILDQRYVDSVDAESLFERTIGDMLHSLDPHSNYIPARDLQAMNEQIEGKFSGVGVRFFVIRDTICITYVLPDSPSEKAGVKSGDKIVTIEGKPVAGKGISDEDVLGLLKGREHTQVEVIVLRGKDRLKKTITRGPIPIESVVAHYMIDRHIGYVKINNFSKTTVTAFREAAQELKRKGMKKIIVDLRNNGGGVLTSATDIADEFLPANKVIVVTKGQHFPKQEYKSTSNGMLIDTPVAVLINAQSASASEILAGALQDNDRGIIVGRRSYGKGLVQEDMELRDGSNLRLTIARYYTPTGRCIQKSYSGSMSDYGGDYRERYENGEMYSVDSSVFVDSLRFVTPKGKVVYGGGGIMPDRFVAYDSTGITPYLMSLRFTSVFTTFAFDYVQDKRNRWKSVQSFNQQFVATNSLIRRFADFAWNEYQIPIREAQLQRSKNLIAELIKGEIARQLWIEQGYYQSINPGDNEFQEAIRALR